MTSPATHTAVNDPRTRLGYTTAVQGSRPLAVRVIEQADEPEDDE